MAWNEDKGQGRYEVIFKDRAFHDDVTARATRLDMSVPEYLMKLARAVWLLEQGDYALVSILGVGPLLASVAPRGESPPLAPPAPRDTALIDSGLDQLGL